MTSEIKVTGHEWSEESLFCKAVLFFEQMESHAADDWQYGFWTALSLEFLARAASCPYLSCFFGGPPELAKSGTCAWQKSDS